MAFMLSVGGGFLGAVLGNVVVALVVAAEARNRRRP